MLEAGAWANVQQKPVVFDPVGVGATAHRRAAAKGTELHFMLEVTQWFTRR
jgi:hydroxyethylthiazole kinase-like sugar kinase family protein